MTIEQFIIDLLKHHNCVVVPNFGGFIANYQPAIVDSVTRTISPPSKQVLFNAKLLQNDGLLASYVAEKRTISYPESLIQIETRAQEWKQTLAQDKRLAFGEIGFLYEQDGTIVFEQSRDTNLWLKAYGLSSIQFVETKAIVEDEAIEKTVTSHVAEPISSKMIQEPIEREVSPKIILSQTENIEPVSENQESAKVIPLVQEKKSSKKWGYIVAACALPFLFYTYWIPMETNFLETGNIQLSDFNPFNTQKVSAVYSKRLSENQPIETDPDVKTFDQKTADLTAEVKVYQYEFDESLYIPVDMSDKTKVAKHIADTQTSGVQGKTAPIQVITGCFSVKSNASNFVSELLSFGYSAYILDKSKGLYRVAIQGFTDMRSAKEVKADLKSKSYSSWILKQ